MAPKMAKDRENVVKMAWELEAERQIAVNATIRKENAIGEARARRITDTWGDVLTNRRRSEGFDDMEAGRREYRRKVIDARFRAPYKMRVEKGKRPKKRLRKTRLAFLTHLLPSGRGNPNVLARQTRG